MMRKNKFLAAILAVILVLPAFSFSAAAVDTPGQADVRNAVFIDYFAEVIWVIPAGAAQTQARNRAPNGFIVSNREDLSGGGINNYVSNAVAESARGAAAGSAPQYMFSLRAVPDAQTAALAGTDQRARDRALNSLFRERWMPVYGGGVNITRAIPTNPNRPFYVAIRRADDLFTTNRGFESRVAFRIAPRYNQRAFRGVLRYHPGNPDAPLPEVLRGAPGNEVVKLTSNMPNGIIYNFDLFSPVHALNGLIPAPSHRFVLGTQVNVSSAPRVNSDGDGVEWARSRNVRFRIPRRTAMPNVAFNAVNARITGMRNHFQFSLDVQCHVTGTWEDNPHEPTWHVLVPDRGTTAITAQLEENFASLREHFRYLNGNMSAMNENNDNVFRIWVRVAPVVDTVRPTRNAPASEPRLIEIPRGHFTAASLQQFTP